MTSTAPAVDSCQITGETAATCGSLRKMSATFTDTGAPLIPAIKDDPGGCTMTSAPIPAALARASFRMPSDNPTISRISVTSRAMAIMLITDRIGRYTRLATIMRFIMQSALSGQHSAVQHARAELQTKACLQRSGILYDTPHLLWLSAESRVLTAKCSLYFCSFPSEPRV